MTFLCDFSCLGFFKSNTLNRMMDSGTIYRTEASMGIPKIKSVSELRKDLYNSLKEVSEGAPQVVTHKQGEPVVLISQSEFNRLTEENLILRSLEAGLADIRAGRIHSTKDIKNKLKQRRKERDSGHMV